MKVIAISDALSTPIPEDIGSRLSFKVFVSNVMNWYGKEDSPKYDLVLWYPLYIQVG